MVEIPFPDELVGRYQAYTQADLTRLRGAGYEGDFTALEDGVAAYVRILEASDGYHRTPAVPSSGTPEAP